MSTILEKVS